MTITAAPPTPVRRRRPSSAQAVAFLRDARQLPGVTNKLLSELTGIPIRRISALINAKTSVMLPIEVIEQIAVATAPTVLRREVSRRATATATARRIRALPGPAKALILSMLDPGFDLGRYTDERVHITEEMLSTIEWVTPLIVQRAMDAHLTAVRLRGLRAQGHDCERQARAYQRSASWVNAVCLGAINLVTPADEAAVRAYARDVMFWGPQRGESIWGGNLADAEYAEECGWYPLACYDDDNGIVRGGRTHSFLQDFTDVRTRRASKRHDMADSIVRVIELSLAGKPAETVAHIMGLTKRDVNRYRALAGLTFQVISRQVESGTRKVLSVEVGPVDKERAQRFAEAIAELRGMPADEQDAVAMLATLGVSVRGSKVPVAQAA
ncbi:hypothetical protein [Nonomuraea sp. NPDC023979]|uniref:hypothetical protein n=1 Tax=Nonomuraea sp. NPDC023979 TaxID=3154796 RepID=UPI0033F697A3